MSPLVIGTAGHVDHGKTALVTALTGAQTDRLAEERRRGISIELGYARLALPSGRRMSVIDVPGHERFVRTMVAGASGIDMFLLCVAADDGVMPQTREHLAVLRALGIGHGVVAITRSDLADAEKASAEVAQLVPHCAIVPVAAPTGAGVDKLLSELECIAVRVPERDPASGPAVLHIDRSFTLKGHGTVVTGTLWSGTVIAGEKLTVLPLGERVRVRSVQVHGDSVESARAGQRVALGLTGLSWRDLERGDVVCGDGERLVVSFRVDAAVELEEGARPLQRGDRVQVHHGARHVTARVIPLEGDSVEPGRRNLCQLRCVGPLIPRCGDRLVLRQIAPPDTIGGGLVIDPSPTKHGPDAKAVEALLGPDRIEPSSATPTAKRRAPSPSSRSELTASALQVAELLLADGDRPRSDAMLAATMDLPPGELTTHLRALEHHGTVVRVGPKLHFHAHPLTRLTARALAICRRDGKVTVPDLRDELATSRRYAQALLEHLDSRGITIRRGDEHVLRRRPRSDDGVEPSKRRASPP